MNKLENQEKSSLDQTGLSNLFIVIERQENNNSIKQFDLVEAKTWEAAIVAYKWFYKDADPKISFAGSKFEVLSMQELMNLKIQHGISHKHMYNKTPKEEMN